MNQEAQATTLIKLSSKLPEVTTQELQLGKSENPLMLLRSSLENHSLPPFLVMFLLHS
jgi:hypothetical protein